MDHNVLAFLRDAAAQGRISESDLLRRVLHIGGPAEYAEFGKLFTGAGSEFVHLLTSFDYALRLRNPGLHYVFRTKYMGFRRETRSGFATASARSQIFACALARTQIFTVVLPLDPQSYLSYPQARDLSGTGHHGVGDLVVEIPDQVALGRFIEEFDDWLSAYPYD
jgi:predicted transport protein